MKNIEIILGPKPFAGLSDSSKEIAVQYQKFMSSEKRMQKLLKQAKESNINSILFYFNPALVKALKKQNFNCYPIVPDASQYIRDINKYGMVGTGIRRLKSLGLINVIKLGFIVPKLAHKILKKNFKAILSLLVHIEMMQLKKLRPKIVFLHYQITDLALANSNKDLLFHFADIIRKKYKTEVGFMTRNLSELSSKLEEWKIPAKSIAAPFNKKGYMMLASKKKCEQVANQGNFIIFPTESLAGSTILFEEGMAYLRKNKINKIIIDAGLPQELDI